MFDQSITMSGGFLVLCLRAAVRVDLVEGTNHGRWWILIPQNLKSYCQDVVEIPHFWISISQFGCISRRAGGQISITRSSHAWLLPSCSPFRWSLDWVVGSPYKRVSYPSLEEKSYILARSSFSESSIVKYLYLSDKRTTEQMWASITQTTHWYPTITSHIQKLLLKTNTLSSTSSYVKKWNQPVATESYS